MKHPALRVPPGGNQVDGLPPAAIIGFNGTENGDKVCTHGPKKYDDRPNFGESHFWSSGSLDKAFSSHFLVISMFSVTRRAGWAHPNSKSNTVFGKSSK